MLAARSGVDQPTIARLERGTLPGISLRRLARILGCIDILDLRRP
jgi:predicted transcriptional regulator